MPTHGTETFFLRTLGLNVTSTWAPWQCENEDGHRARAGYHEKFGGTKHGIDFVTFNGAGHMVPQYKPVEALALMKRWLAGASLRDGTHSSKDQLLRHEEGELTVVAADDTAAATLVARAA